MEGAVTLPLQARMHPHPRRKPAHNSVSLRHHRPTTDTRSRRPHAPQEDAPQSSPAGIVSYLLKSRMSSGETSNADHWFDKSNDNVTYSKTSLVDDEAPFYISDSSGYEYDSMAPPTRPVLVQNASNGSSSDEYRSIIDDLTIQNKKLKQKLKKLENDRTSRIGSDKLFEVKIHGLNGDKKHELKDLLRRFAQSLTEPSGTSSADADPSHLPAPRVGATLKPSSTFSSTRVTDSGYGSMSHSRRTFTPHFITDGRPAPNPLEASKAREQNIRTFLSDIPQGLLAKHPTVMSERDKKKLVVRRLEQIFGGRGAAPGLHQQPIQQQEVARLAEKADRDSIHAKGQSCAAEGSREARIMDNEGEASREASRSIAQQFEHAQSKATQGIDNNEKIEEQDFAAQDDVELSSHEQRPTRPLDLDPHRAQIPQENVQYIRHLGFSLPDVKSAVDGEGWLYLNLLINMAQLHTLNVTPDFIKNALMDYSERFELSNDGRKLRWKGGEDLTRTTSSESGHYADSSEGQPRSQKLKRAKFDNNNSRDGNAASSSSKRVRIDSEMDRFAYRPLFPLKAGMTDTDSDMLTTNDDSSRMSTRLSSWPDKTGPSSGLTDLSSTKRQADGPIIFYNNARFCTDLSGEIIKTAHANRNTEYQCFSKNPLGTVAIDTAFSEEATPASSRPLLTGAYLAEDNSDCSLITNFDLEPARSSPKRVSFADPEKSLHFEVSGIGGVYPEDNCAITVLRQHIIDPSTHATRRVLSNLDHLLPEKMTTPKTNETVRSVQVKHLRPSALPPPSFAFEDCESSDGSQSSESEDEEIKMLRATIKSGCDFASSAAIASVDSTSSPSSTPVNQPNRGSYTNRENQDDEEGEEDDDDDGDDGSLDFLADARAVDPDTIRAKEREYDANAADRLADEIPAGSSAATAAGGSGFNSPVGPVGVEEEEEEDDNDGYEDEDDDDDDDDTDVDSRDAYMGGIGRSVSS